MRVVYNDKRDGSGTGSNEGPEDLFELGVVDRDDGGPDILMTAKEFITLATDGGWRATARRLDDVLQETKQKIDDVQTRVIEAQKELKNEKEQHARALARIEELQEMLEDATRGRSLAEKQRELWQADAMLYAQNSEHHEKKCQELEASLKLWKERYNDMVDARDYNISRAEKAEAEIAALGVDAAYIRQLKAVASAADDLLDALGDEACTAQFHKEEKALLAALDALAACDPAKKQNVLVGPLQAEAVDRLTAESDRKFIAATTPPCMPGCRRVTGLVTREFCLNCRCEKKSEEPQTGPTVDHIREATDWYASLPDTGGDGAVIMKIANLLWQRDKGK